MPKVRQSVPAAPVEAFTRLRAELDLPAGFGPEVEQAAATAAAAGPLDGAAVGRVDLGHVPFVTIDPPGSRDLDQALHLESRGSGLRVWYAIADVAAFVRPGDPVDLEARERGRTVYLPDGTVPLHPRVLSEGAASLLPDVDRPAVVWQVDLDADGAVVAHDLRRATIRSRARLTYDEAQTASAAPGSVAALLLELGRRRQELEWRRGGISLGLPDVRVELVDGRPHLRLRQQLPIEEANAQLSLLVGIVAADDLVTGGVGILRTLPDPRADDVDELRADARALGAPWPSEIDVATFLRTLHAARARDAALLVSATRTLRGAGYQALGPDVLPQRHGAVAAHYAHVTAPLRRLVDRYAHEVLLALHADVPVPQEVLLVLPTLPGAMDRGSGRAGAAERATTDLAEAVLLSSRVGERLRAVPVRKRGDEVEVRVVDPPVVATVRGHAPLGVEVTVRVASVDVPGRRIELVLDDGSAGRDGHGGRSG
jgi:exoribonuclease R